MIYDYDALGQMTSVTDPSGQQVSYMYDLAGNLKTVQYPDGQKNVYSYDELGRRTLLEKSSGGTTLNIYDTDGNITRMLTGKSDAITFQYNADGLVTEAAGPDFKTNYTYDNVGRRTSMTDGQGTTSYAYDPADGSLTGLKYPDGTQISYEYNKQSRTGYVLTDAAGTSMHVQSKLDSVGRVTQMDISAGTGVANVQSLGEASAAAGGSLDSMTFDYAPNGLLKGQSSSRGLSTRFSYNGLDLSGVTVEQGGTALHQFGYERDGNKNIIGRTQNGTTDQFGYDPSNRIASEAAGEKNKTYGYDPNGNRSAESSGKVFGMKNAEYTYDSVSRLTKVTGEGKEVGYSYNGDGLLYERTEGGKTTRYYYDEEAKLIAEAEVQGGTAKITYAYVYDLSGQLWARQDKVSGQLQYYQLNGHGDVVGLSDSSGKELNSYSYDIWGGPEKVKETVPNVLRYAGEYWDDTTGLQYLRARWYDPGTARFMGEDTYQGEMSDPQSLNGYAYAANNPLFYVDPSGHLYSVPDIENLLGYSKQFTPNDAAYWLAREKLGTIFGPIYGEANNNRYKYLFGMMTRTGSYGNTSGNASWAQSQLLADYTKWRRDVGISNGLAALSPGSKGVAGKLSKTIGAAKGAKGGLVKPEAAVNGSKKHGVNWKEGPARAKNEGKPQGQWNKADLDYATEKANTLKPGENGYFDLPSGSKSIIHLPDGTTVPATKMWVRNNGTGTWHGYPMP
jgi:RHS repeat-associated protein